MAQPVQRLHYFNGQFLREPDFTAEQQYHMQQDRDHMRLLHTPGISEGLDIPTPAAGATAVTVNAGVAFDDQGRRIALADNQIIDLGTLPANQTVYLTIAYQEVPSSPTNETGVSGDARWTEDPLIEKLAALPANQNEKLVLARITRSGTTINGIDRTLRRTAGVKAGNLQAPSLTLTSDTVAPGGWVTMNLGAASRADLLGDLRVTGKLTVEGETTVVSTERMQGNVILGDADTDIATVEGTLVSGHSSGRLKIGSPVDVAGNLQVTGNIGIGTATPGSILEVNKTQNVPTELRVLNSDPGPGAAANVLVGSVAAGGTYGYLGYFGSGYTATGIFQARRTVLSGQDTGGLHLAATHPSGAMTFITGGGATVNERMRIDALGNVGIGTTTPTLNGGGLEISRTSQAAVRVSATAAGGKSAEFGADTIGGFIQTVTQGATFRIYTGGGPQPQPRVVVDSTGNVGIGTMNLAGHKLQVEGSTLLNAGSLYLADTAGQTPTQLQSYSNANSLWLLQPTRQRLVLAETVNWDSGVVIQYTAGTLGAAAGALLIGQLDRNVATWTHGYTALHTNGAERMRINSSGNVGIGTTAPTSELHIRKDAPGQLGPNLTLMNGGGGAGSAAAIDLCGYDTGTQAPALRLQCIDDGAFSAHLSFSAKQPGANANPLMETMRITSAGNVGIGTTAPNVKLDVLGEVQVTTLSFQDSAGLVYPHNWLGMAANVDGLNNKWLHIGGIMDNTDNTGPKRRIGLFADHVFMNGSLGIGKAKPAKPLDVAAAGGIRISQIGAADQTNELYFQDNGQIRSFDDNHRIIFDRANNILELREHGDLVFSPGATSSARTQTVTFKSGGNVGIGTTNPGERLDVNGRVKAGPMTVGPWPANPGAYAFVGANTLNQAAPENYALLQGSAGGDLGRTYLNSPLDIRFRINNGDRMVLNANGNVNMLAGANANPLNFTSAWSGSTDGAATNVAEISNDIGQYKTLMIVGNRSNGGPRRVSVWDRLEVNGDAYKTGGGAWLSTSDQELKKDIAPIDGALEKLLQLRGVSFAWREPEQQNASDGRYMGMVAQEVEKVFPEWVKPVPSGHKGLELIGFEALVVEALRELSAKCERLEAEVAQLRGSAAKPKAAASARKKS